MIMGMARGPVQLPRAERFWSRVDKSGECWLWKGVIIQRGGYGHFYDDDQRLKRAHRVAWELTHGVIPDGVVCHSCDRPACVHPAHLFIGSQGDNLADMRRKGRGFVPPPEHGAERYNARLTDDIVRSMRSAASSGATIKNLAAAAGVSYSTALHAIRGETWAHVQ